MNRFDNFCNLLMEVYGNRVSVPYDGRSAPDRFNNPGGAYPKKGFERYGMEGYDRIGGGHPIAKYPTLANGIAANIAHLKSMPIVGKTVGQARYYWVNGNFGGTKELSGMDSNEVITQEKLNDPNWLAQWMKGTAQDEGFTKGGRTIDNNSLAQAMDILKNNSNLPPSSQYDSSSQYASSNSVKPVSKLAAANGANSQQSTSEQPPEQTNSGEVANANGEKEETNPFMKTISDIYSKAEGGTIGKEIAKQAYDTASNMAKNLLSKYGSKLS